MPKRTNIGSDAARMARAAASDLANLQRAMRAAGDTMAGLQRAIKAPNTTARRHMLRGTRTTPPFIYNVIGRSLGAFASSGINGGDLGDFGSFLPSAGQFAAQITNASFRGQRIL